MYMFSNVSPDNSSGQILAMYDLILCILCLTILGAKCSEWYCQERRIGWQPSEYIRILDWTCAGQHAYRVVYESSGRAIQVSEKVRLVQLNFSILKINISYTMDMLKWIGGTSQPLIYLVFNPQYLKSLNISEDFSWAYRVRDIEVWLYFAINIKFVMLSGKWIL
jgi:hypothetical protein